MQQHDYLQEWETSCPRALCLHNKVQCLYYFVAKDIALEMLVHYWELVLTTPL